jgi:hypothetical protein
MRKLCVEFAAPSAADVKMCSRTTRSAAATSHLHLVVGIAAGQNMKTGWYTTALIRPIGQVSVSLPCPSSLTFHLVAMASVPTAALTTFLRD